MKNLILLLLITVSFNTTAQTEYDKFTKEGFELLQKCDIFKAIEKDKLALKFNNERLDANDGIAICYSSTSIQNGSYCIDAIDHFLIVEEVSGAYRSTFQNISAC